METYYATLKDPDSEQRRFVTVGGESKDDALEKLRVMEAEYVSFRLDEENTRLRFGYPDDVLEIVEEHHSINRSDTDRDGRFIRAGKSLGPNAQMRGWLALHHQEKPYRVTSIGPESELMVVTAGQYGVPALNRSNGVANGAVSWKTGGDTFKVALTTNTYTVDIDTHDFFNDVTNEVSGTGYTAGGATLSDASLASTYDTASDQARFDAADTTWTTSTITARKAVVYKSTGTSTTSPLISFVDFGADVSTTAGTFQITWDVTGVWLIDVT